jgi:ABC-2 type transport system ATP-binding protein
MTTTDSTDRWESPEVLRVINLAKRYGEEKAVAGITSAANAGEVLGLVGPNGAGKTTLLETLVGLFGADSGSIRWLGDELQSYRKKQGNVLSA